MGYLQQYNAKNGIQTPTATSSGGGYLQQYNANPPKPTVAPKKVTEPAKKIATPATPVQKAQSTLQNIIKGITMSLVPPKQKVISPIPDSQVIKPTVPDKKISIIPGQKYLQPEELKKAFPQTAMAVKDLMTPQKTDAKKAATEAWNAIKDPFIEQIKRQQENMTPSKALAERTAKQVKVYTGFANVALSPIGAVFAALNNSNLKGATKAIAVPFVAVGEGASKISDKIIDELPFDKKTKETLKPAFAEVASLAAQIALGKVIDIGSKKAGVTIKKVGSDAFEKFTKNVIEESGSARTINLTKDQARDVLRNIGDKQTIDLFKTLDIEQRVQAVKDGITIEIPAEKIVRIIDKPYWEKVKSIFNVKPTDITKTSVGSPSTKGGFAGYLEDGQYAPQEVIGKVIEGGLEKTPEGKAVIKASLEAQRRGMDIRITGKTEKPVVKTPEDPLLQEARKYKSAEEFVRGQETKSPTYAVGEGSGHTAPLRGDETAPLHKLDEIYPNDIYSPDAKRLYGSGFGNADSKAFDIINKVKDNPNAEVTIYRAVPKGQGIKDFNKGDWITLTKDYAKQHGESNLSGGYEILSKKVRADEIFTDANSIQEFGYDPKGLTKSQLTDIWNKANEPQVPKEADQSLLTSQEAKNIEQQQTPRSKKTLEELKQKQQAIEQARQANESKKSILDQYSTNQIRAMRAIKRSVSALESKSLDPTNVSKTASYQDHIETVMSALDTTSEDVALQYIMNDLPDALTSASTRQELEDIKVLKSKIEPKEVPVPRDQLPTGEGKPKVSRLEARMKGVMKKATPQQIEDLGLSTYNTLNRKETIAKAAEYVTENPKEALSVLQGNTVAPEGISPEAIYVALTQVAKGDLTLATKLASLQATALGQRISLLAELDPNSPVKLLNEVYKVREEQFKKRHGGKTLKEVQKKVTQQIKESVKKPDKYDWNNFISALEC